MSLLILAATQVRGECTPPLPIWQRSPSRDTALKLPPILGVNSCIAGDPPGTNEQMALLLYVLVFRIPPNKPSLTAASHVLSYVAPFVVNALLLLATFYRSWSITKQLQGVKLPILQHLVKDGALYFACITIVNAVNVYFYNRTLSFASTSLGLCTLLTLSRISFVPLWRQNRTTQSSRSTCVPSSRYLQPCRADSLSRCMTRRREPPRPKKYRSSPSLRLDQRRPSARHDR